MLFVAFPDNGVLGLRHERIALLPRHRGETAAFLPADLVEDDLGELAFALYAVRPWRELRFAALAVAFGRLTAAFAFVAFFFVFFIGVPSFGTPLTIRVSREKASANLVGTEVQGPV